MERIPAGALLGDHYEILEEIGCGGMSRVYRARDRALDREVAIKILHGELTRRPATVARLIREAQAMAALAHPNVARVFDIGESERGPYFVMEFVRGRTLAKALADPAYPLDQRVRVIEEAARGVHAAHEYGVIHRDLKPANIMIAETGLPSEAARPRSAHGDTAKEGRVVVMDFGMAHLLNTDEHLSRTGIVLGTPLYMSPEQANGDHRATDARTDVYALGVILYEAMTRRLPFDGDTALAVYGKIISEEPEPPRRIDPELPAELEAVCLRAMAKAPDLRYPTARDLADDLRRSRAGEPTVAARVSASRAFQALARRPKVMARPSTPARRLAWAAAALAAAALVALGFAMRDRPARSGAAIPPRELSAPPSPEPVLFEDSFDADPASSGRWTIRRWSHESYTKDPENEAHRPFHDATGGFYYLTRARSYCGTSMFAKAELTARAWIARFRFRTSGEGRLANGFVFCFYKQPVETHDAERGSNVAFEGAPGYGVFFDCYAGNRPDLRSVSLVKDTLYRPLATVVDARAGDQRWHDVEVAFRDGLVTVRIDREKVLEHAIGEVDYASTGFGFTSAVGAAFTDHAIDDFRLAR